MQSENPTYFPAYGWAVQNEAVMVWEGWEQKQVQ